MDAFAALLDFVPVVVVPLVFWIRGLQNKIEGLAASIMMLEAHLEKSGETQSREHKEVADLIRGLEENVGTKIEKIMGDHSDHDKQNTRIETKMDGIVRILEKS